MKSWLKTAFFLVACAVVDLGQAGKVAVSSCEGYSSPVGCTRGQNCGFEATWTLSNPVPSSQDPTGNNDRMVTFNVTIRRLADKASHFYTAVGFSDHQAMPDTDVVIGYAYNNAFLEVVDGYITPEGMNPPVVDQRQDLLNASGYLVDDPVDRTKKILSFVFTRKLDTADKPQDISLAQCRYFFFVTNGGDVTGPRLFGKHDTTPDMSTEKICLAQCQSPGMGSTGGSSGAGSIGGSIWALIISLAFFWARP